MTALKDTVFLLDVDNTLLDNDRIVSDLRAHLDLEFAKGSHPPLFDLTVEKLQHQTRDVVKCTNFWLHQEILCRLCFHDRRHDTLERLHAGVGFAMINSFHDHFRSGLLKNRPVHRVLNISEELGALRLIVRVIVRAECRELCDSGPHALLG